MFDATGAPAKNGARIDYLDNLRFAIIILVILHHVSVVYGADTPFYYVEPHDALTTAVMVVFQLLNQAWFMGAFFLLSGYFNPASFDRKGAGGFLRDRLIRLGIPLLFYSFVLGPIASIGVYKMPVSLSHVTTPLSWKSYPGMIGFGPLWFAELLLIFDFCYAGFRVLFGNRAKPPLGDPRPLSYRNVAVFVVLLAAAAYLLRIVLPIGAYFLGYPSLYYFPQYASFFCVGVAASRRRWLRTTTATMGKKGLLTAAAATLVLFPIALSGLGLGPAYAFLGRGHWQSAVYALWDSVFSVGLVLGLIVVFREFFDRRSRLSLLLSRQSFAVYIIHIPILVFLAIAIRGVRLEGLLKFCLLSIMAVPSSFALAYLLRRIPGVARVV